MALIWGLVLILLAVLAWGGQTLSWLAPARAVRMGLADAADDVEPVFDADGRGEARADAFTLWPLLVAGVLLVAGHDSWAYFGLTGGAVYAYFGARGVSARLEMQRRGLRIGTPGDVRVAYGFLTLWGLVGVVTMIVAARDLQPG